MRACGGAEVVSEKVVAEACRLPLNTTLPLFSRYTWSARARARLTYCSTMSSAVPDAAIWPRNSKILSTTTGASPIEASSTMTTFGSAR